MMSWLQCADEHSSSLAWASLGATDGITASTYRVQCNRCDRIFATRNELFKHLRTTECIPADALRPAPVRKRVYAMLITYTDSDNADMQKTAIQALLWGVARIAGVSASKVSKISPTATPVVAPAAADVVMVEFGASDTQTAKLADLVSTSSLNDAVHAELLLHNTSCDVHVLCARAIPRGHTNSGSLRCTQRRYHYMMPLWWLGHTCTEDIAHAVREAATFIDASAAAVSPDQGSPGLTLTPGARALLSSMKRALGQAASKTNNNCSARAPNDTNGHLSAPVHRCGSLRYKMPRWWHNFDSGPQCERQKIACENSSVVEYATCSALDRCRVVECIGTKAAGCTFPHLCLELAGEQFVEGQISRVIGVAVCIARGWLSRDFFLWACSPNFVLPADVMAHIAAPKHRTYLRELRFDWFTRLEGGIPLFGGEGTSAARRAAQTLRAHIARKAQELMACSDEKCWLRRCECEWCPRLNARISEARNASISPQTLEPLLSGSCNPSAASTLQQSKANKRKKGPISQNTIVSTSSKLEAIDQRALRLVESLSPPLEFRRRSTDALAIIEILGTPGAYCGPPSGYCYGQGCPLDSYSFDPRDHTVLDIGAHIGVFTRYALCAGAFCVIAFEPEAENAALFRRNCEVYFACSTDSRASRERCVELHEAAVVHNAPQDGCGTASLLLGRDRVVSSSGDIVVRNTWRHSLSELSHYSPSAVPGRGGALRACTVPTVPLFGTRGALASSNATFVKLDCEGAELALLSGFKPGDWLGVTHLIFEWSFTKQRDMRVFRSAVARLEREGFHVAFRRTVWDTLESWRWHTDAIVFAARDTLRARTSVDRALNVQKCSLEYENEVANERDIY